MRDRVAGPCHESLRPTGDAWDRFEHALAQHLRRPGAVGAMEFSAPFDSIGDQARCRVQLAGDGSLAWVTFRPSGESLTEQMVTRASPATVGSIAPAVVGACRDLLAVPHPQLLTLRCRGPVSRHAERLGLTRSDSVPIGIDPADDTSPVDVAVEVNGPEDVRERFAAIVERVTEHVTVVDDDGDLVFDHAGQTIHISFTADLPSARLWAWVVRGVRSRSDTAMELATLNREEEWTSWILDGRHVMQRTTVPVGPFLPRHTQFHVEHFLCTFASTRGGIAARLRPGGTRP